MKGLYGIKLVLVFLLVFVITRESKKSINRIDSQSPEIVAFEDEMDSVITLDEFDISFDEMLSMNRWKRNPFLPYYNLSAEGLENQQTHRTYTPKLERIYRDEGVYKAVVNKTIVREGDAYLDLTVAYVGESILVFQQANNQQLALKLVPEGN
ncbi:hypothetical protein JW960_17935 [candidate division KSB1 bacterium]|nr:hypothetical protein [candidate division KSB1 bacterium]